MDLNTFFQIISIGVSVVGSIIVMSFYDGKSKAKVLEVEDKISAIKLEHSAAIAINAEKVNQLDVRLAKSEQDRIDIHRTIERLDQSKASKDVVEGFRNEIENLRVDMDKRFDRLEKLMQERNK